jgi:hypothetical protein
MLKSCAATVAARTANNSVVSFMLEIVFNEAVRDGCLGRQDCRG